MSNTSNTDAGNWLENATSAGYIKHFEYDEFTGIKEVNHGSFGYVSCANRKNSDTVMALKSYKSNTIEKIVNEVVIIII